MPLTLKPQNPVQDWPEWALFYGAPKVGKTTTVAALTGHYIMELDRSGGRYLRAAYDRYDTCDEFIAGLKEIQDLDEKKRPRFLIIDTIDRLEDFALTLAVESYTKRFPAAKLSGGAELLNLPYGSGYGWLRESFNTLLDAIRELEIPTIFLGHVRPKALDKEIKETATEDLSVTGRVRDIICGAVDLIGFLMRDRKGNLVVSTRTSKEVNCGCRIARLSNQDHILVENKNGKLVSHWDFIYGKLA